MTQPKTLLFDLGGVIVPWRGIIELSRITGLPETHILGHANTSDIFKAYEIGGCNTSEFIDALNHMFTLNMDRASLGRLWDSWVHPPYGGTREALMQLKPSYKIACLSNTNASHWSHLEANCNIMDVFDYQFASHILKTAKPDAAAWTLCLDAMNVVPTDVLFFDDTPKNIKAAQSLGIESYLVEPSLGVIPVLEKLGLLYAD